MKRIIITTILIAVLAFAQTDAANKKDKKYIKKQLTTEQPTVIPAKEEVVTISNPAKQLYGEWTIESIRKKALNTTNRAYIYLDFNGKQFYGNNSCNTINGKFSLIGDNITFKDIITTTESCKDNNDRNVMKAFAEVQRFQVVKLNNVERLHLLNNKGNVIIILKRQNLDVLNGAWTVKEAEGENVAAHNVKMVIDVNMLAIHGNTGCNIINGVITLDPKKDFAIQFEDLHSSKNKCENIDVETDVLLALEQTESYKKINDNEIAFLNNEGKTVLILNRLRMR